MWHLKMFWHFDILTFWPFKSPQKNKLIFLNVWHLKMFRPVWHLGRARSETSTYSTSCLLGLTFTYSVSHPPSPPLHYHRRHNFHDHQIDNVAEELRLQRNLDSYRLLHWQGSPSNRPQGIIVIAIILGVLQAQTSRWKFICGTNISGVGFIFSIFPP